MEEMPINVFSPWSSYDLGSSIFSKKTSNLHNGEIFQNYDLIDEEKEKISSENSSSPALSSDDDKSLEREKLNGGSVQNGFARQEIIDNLILKVLDDPNDQLGLAHLQESSVTKSKYEAGTNGLLPINGVDSCSKENILPKDFYSNQNGNINLVNYLLDSTNPEKPFVGNHVSSNVINGPVRERNGGNSSRDQSFCWPFMNNGQQVSSPAPFNDLASSLTDSLAMPPPSPSHCLNNFNPISSELSAQNNFLNNIKKLNQLNECSSALMSTDFDSMLGGSNLVGDGLGIEHLMLSQDLSPIPELSSISSIQNTNHSSILPNSPNPSKVSMYNALAENVSNFNNNLPPTNIFSNLPFRDSVKRSSIASNNASSLSNIHQSIPPPPISSNNQHPGKGLSYPYGRDPQMGLKLPHQQISPMGENNLHLNGLDPLMIQKLQRQHSLPPNHPPPNIFNPLNSDPKHHPHHPRNLTRSQSDLNADLLSPTDRSTQFMPPNNFSPRKDSALPLDMYSMNAGDMYPPRSPVGYQSPPDLSPMGDLSHPVFSLPPSLLGYRTLRPGIGSNDLHLRLEECYDQFRQLERERKKTEAELARCFPGKRVSSANNVPLPRLPPAPSRVDRLVIDHLREHARVVTLVNKMERLRGAILQLGIHKALANWHESILKVQEIRKKEVISALSNRNGLPQQNPFTKEQDLLALCSMMSQLVIGSRKARTALYCALSLTTLFSLDSVLASSATFTSTDTTTNLSPTSEVATEVKPSSPKITVASSSADTLAGVTSVTSANSSVSTCTSANKKMPH